MVRGGDAVNLATTILRTAISKKFVLCPVPCPVPCSTNARINPHQSRRAVLNARRSCGSCAERHGLTVCQSYLRLSAWPAEYFISRSDDAHGSHYNVASSRGHNGRRLARAWPLVLSSRYRAHADVKTPYRCGEMQQAPTHIKHCAELYDNPVHGVFPSTSSALFGAGLAYPS